MPTTLKLTLPLMNGPAVVRLQELGDLLGFNYGENDGIFGSQTEKVVKAIQKKYRLKRDGICGKATWRTILNAADKLQTEAGNSDSDPNTEDPNLHLIETDSAIESNPSNPPMVDRRDKHPHPRLFAHKRAWSDIEGVTLHQTGCAMPKNATGWDKLNAHIGITAKGQMVLVNDPTHMIWHAQGLSKKTIGIEIAGNYFGVHKVNWTLWPGGGGPDHLSAPMVAALNQTFIWLEQQFTKNNQPFTKIYAHRQSSQSRVSDPGSEIWQRIALPWMEKLGATDGGPNYKIGSGRPIPKSWNKNYTAPFA